VLDETPCVLSTPSPIQYHQVVNLAHFDDGIIDSALLKHEVTTIYYVCTTLLMAENIITTVLRKKTEIYIVSSNHTCK